MIDCMWYVMVWDVVVGGRGMVIGKMMLLREFVEVFGCDSDFMDWELMLCVKFEVFVV